uniref:Uncharacterized protein n=1 Tax=Brassica oleracea TaxID=3712 RepID=A0A3P6B4M9_BRAOL|nr:unnamed protein product [Brassica oleracea]
MFVLITNANIHTDCEKEVNRRIFTSTVFGDSHKLPRLGSVWAPYGTSAQHTGPYNQRRRDHNRSCVHYHFFRLPRPSKTAFGNSRCFSG